MTTNDTGGNDSDGVACPVCGKEFDTETGRNIHRGRVHGDARPEVNCAYCGESKEVKPNRVDKVDNFFCDTECQYAWKNENTAKDYYTKVQATCEYCGRTDEVSASRIQHSRYFCSRACGAKARSGGVSEVGCEMCEERFIRKNSEIRQSERQFCSPDCYADWLSENVRGEDHHLYEHGNSIRYGVGWNKRKKEAVRERDGRECQHCGRSEKDHLEKYGCKHPVHHIQKAHDFDDPEERNAMKNLITLCRGECHATWEKMAPLRPIAEN